jgi:transposase
LTEASNLLSRRDRTEKTPIKYDREAYKRRNLIERCVNRLKQFRRIARGSLPFVHHMRQS